MSFEIKNYLIVINMAVVLGTVFQSYLEATISAWKNKLL